MSKPVPASEFTRHIAPVGHNHSIGTAAFQPVRSFDLPNGLFAATVGLYFAFLAVMAVAFADPGMILPMAIFSIYIIMAFGVPGLWVRMKPAHSDQPPSWARFMREGIATHTGHLAARDATVQMLLLPVLILGWGVGIAAIVASAT